MVLNEDGSGTFSYGFDMSALMKMGKSTDTTKVSKVIDSVFTFKELMKPMKDSIAKLSDIEKQQYKLLEMFRIKLKVNQKQKEFSYEMEFDFPTTDSLKNMVSPTKAAMLLSLSDKKVPKNSLKTEGNEDKSNTSFSYDGKFFIKKVTSTIPSAGKDKSKDKKENKLQDEFSKKMDEMFKECKYSLEYHFPKKIKTVSLKDAKISEDKKSFVVEVPIENLKASSEQLGFKVEFE
jgi:hypothetical protein